MRESPAREPRETEDLLGASLQQPFLNSNDLLPVLDSRSRVLQEFDRNSGLVVPRDARCRGEN